MVRFRKLIRTSAMLKLYKAFILPHFLYCLTVWHFCSSRNRDKLEALNRRTLRIVFHDKDAADQGMFDAQIRALGRWKSNAFLKYIRIPSLTVCLSLLLHT